MTSPHFRSLGVPAGLFAIMMMLIREPEKVGQKTASQKQVAGTVGPLTTTVLIAGDDTDAKSTVAGVFTSGGLDVIDAGSLKRARELEAVGFLQLTLAVNEKVSWAGGFGIAA